MSPYSIYFVLSAASLVLCSTGTPEDASRQMKSTGVSGDDHSRTKRLVWGTPLSEINAYKVTDYFAFISSGNRFSFVIAKIVDLFTRELPNPTADSLRCGGALIRPNWVQTACHCLARWRKTNDSYFEAEAINGWENWSSIFVGYTYVDVMVENGVFSRHYVVHQKCALLMPDIGGAYQSITHDFGLIILNKNVILRGEAKPAPLYTSQALNTVYYTVLRDEAVCLHVGYGAYYWKKPGVPGEKSPVLQHGWRVVVPYWYCFWRTFLHHNKRFLLDFGMRYIDVATWLCTQYFGTERATPLPGDSGSPVTCNDIFTGLISFRDQLFTKTFISTEYVAAVAFAPLLNSLEYRPIYLKMVNEYIDTHPKFETKKPAVVEPQNDWGELFDPDGGGSGIWYLKRFSQMDNLASASDISSLSSRITTGWAAWPLSLQFLYIFHH